MLEHAGCRETGVGSMEGGRGRSESLETPTMLSLSTQSRKQSQSREYTRSVFVSRTASSFSICSLSSLSSTFSLRVSPVSLASILDQRWFQLDRPISKSGEFSSFFSKLRLVVDRAKGFEKSKYAWTFDLL